MKKEKYILVVFANYILVPCAFLFYRQGANIDPLFMILQIILVFLNHMITNKKLSLLFLHVNLLISTILTNWLLTHLYYTRISSDPGTIMVGQLVVAIEAIWVIVLSGISLLIRIFAKRTDSRDKK